MLESKTVRVQINGEEREGPHDSTLLKLINYLSLVPERLAIELNQQVVRRAAWAETTLKEDDRIEIVHFVGGGCAVV